MKWLDMIQSSTLYVIAYVSMLVSGAVLVLAGWQHVTAPAASLVGEWLTGIGITAIGELGLSLGGVATLLVMVVGVVVGLNGLSLIYYGARNLLDWLA